MDKKEAQKREIWIYGDESGIVPKSAKDGPFVAALVVSPQPITRVEHRSKSVHWLIGQFHKRHLRPAICYVHPRPGFGQAWKRNFDQRNTMARLYRLQSGRHDYLTGNDSLSPNFIWVRAMLMAVQRAVTQSMFDGPVAKITLVLEQKSLANETNRFREDQLQNLIPHLRRRLEGYPRRDLHPSLVSAAKAYHENIEACSINFRWGTTNGVPALWLAHHLARLSRRELGNRNKTSLFQEFSHLGHWNFSHDMTNDLIDPPSAEIEADWRRRTGLPVPQI